MHTSIKLTTPCEFIKVEPLNPLISKCQIKVCYVGEQPNRNKSIITKEVATQMANSLPGSPIVGYFNDNTKDFEEHNRTIDISNGKFEMKDTTRPYGFVPTDAKVWFQQYQDDGEVIREYLCTEGYLWTGQYPECQRVIDKGNNQSMELDTDRIDAYWTKDENGKPKFFIINEAIVSKLCILGEDCEPCFEGASVTQAEVNFSLGDDFKAQLFSMMQEIKDLLVDNNEKGGAQVFTKYAVEIGDALWSALYSYIEKNYPDGENSWCSIYRIEGIFEDGGQKFAVLQNRKDLKYFKLNFSLSEAEGLSTTGSLEEVTKVYVPASEPQFALEDVEQFETEYKKAKEEDEEKEKGKDEGEEGKSDKPETDDKVEGEDKKDPEDKKEEPEDKDDEDDKKKKKYSLDEIPEYVELSTKYSELESNYNALLADRDSLKAQLEPLVEFKAQAEKAQKEEMIKSFYMLSEEDKKDVVTNIDKYSLDEIEAKLSIICVRNKVSFNLDEENHKDDPMVYNLGGSIEEDATTPAWVKAALKTAQTLK